MTRFEVDAASGRRMINLAVAEGVHARATGKMNQMSLILFNNIMIGPAPVIFIMNQEDAKRVCDGLCEELQRLGKGWRQSLGYTHVRNLIGLSL